MKSLHLDPVWLRQKYEEEGLSTYQIGAIVGRDPKNVYTKLVEFGIPRRSTFHKIVELAASGAPRTRGWKRTEEGRLQSVMAASRPQPKLRGEGNGMYGRKGADHHNFRGGTTPERQAMYASAEWAAVVRLVMERDGYKCVHCGDGNKRATFKGKSTLCVHHVKSWAAHPALRLDAGNLLTMCEKCHRWVHSKNNVNGDYIG